MTEFETMLVEELVPALRTILGKACDERELREAEAIRDTVMNIAVANGCVATVRKNAMLQL